MGGQFFANGPKEEMAAPPAPDALPRPGAWIGASEIGHEG
jgi:hypothetical protein